MSDPKTLKKLLIQELINRIENGEDKVLESGEVVKIPAPAQVLSVAAKVAKDFAEDKNDAEVSAKDLSGVLERYKQRSAARLDA